jgi:alkylglycerol monooxygenase
MDGVNYIALAIPVFFLLIGVEWLVARFQGRKLYRFNDSINDLSCGILQQVLGVFTKTVVFTGYVAVYEYTRVADIPATAWAWVGCFLLVDMQYYWFHRVSHESNLPWGAHIVHHSSEEYNLSVALRQGSFQHFFSWVFYLPLAWLGFSPLMFLTCSSFNTLYQFWIHTRTIGKLGPLEWVLNTPSHHRVHHGCNPKYIDKNYAGTLIVWDRLFGSFQREEEEPIYGITKPLANWNPLWANFHYYVDLWKVAKEAPGWKEWLQVWWKPPAWKARWTSKDLGHHAVPGNRPTPLTHGEAGKYNARAPEGLSGYILLHFLTVLPMTVFLLFKSAELTLAQNAGLAVVIVWTLTDLGALFDQRRWALPAERLRLVVVALAGLGLGARLAPDSLVPLVGGVLLFFGGSAAWLGRHRRPLNPATPR